MQNQKGKATKNKVNEKGKAQQENIANIYRLHGARGSINAMNNSTKL